MADDGSQVAVFQDDRRGTSRGQQYVYFGQVGGEFVEAHWGSTEAGGDVYGAVPGAVGYQYFGYSAAVEGTGQAFAHFAGAQYQHAAAF